MLREYLAARLAPGRTDVENGQEPTPQSSKRDGDLPVGNNPAWLLNLLRPDQGKLAAVAAANVFGEMIQVRILQFRQHRAAQSRLLPGGAWHEANLKVDQVGMAIRPNNNVLALVQIDVGHLTPMDRVEKLT